VRISGLSHGTDVWLNNAQSLIQSGVARLTDVIACRDDIMNRLISDGLAPKDAFRITERVRKGKGLADGDDQLMRDHGVPEWYIDSCNKIKYMFPRAHAAAYVTMSFRIAYFKVHHPIQFYACYFTIRASDFDSSIIAMSVQDITEALNTIDGNQDATGRDKSLAAIMEAVAEAEMRGITFLPVDIAKSCATIFTIEKGSIRLPLVSVASLGDTAARSVVSAREERPFSSIQDLRDRTRLTRSHIDTLREIGALAGLPETDQLSLF
jgi:DNA polymerase-3 subunit alpha (Gram-positive type)